MDGLKLFEFAGQMGFTRKSFNHLPPARKGEFFQAGANACTLWDKGIQIVRQAAFDGGDKLTLSSRETGEELAILTKGEQTNFLTSIHGFGEDTVKALTNLFRQVSSKTLVEDVSYPNRAVFEIPKLDLEA